MQTAPAPRDELPRLPYGDCSSRIQTHTFFGFVDIVGVTSLGGEEQVGPSSLSSAAYSPATGSGSTSSVITTPASGGGAYIPAINTEGLPMGGSTYMLNFTAKWSPHRSVAA
jgi:hypothetical protein